MLDRQFQQWVIRLILGLCCLYVFIRLLIWYFDEPECADDNDQQTPHLHVTEIVATAQTEECDVATRTNSDQQQQSVEVCVKGFPIVPDSLFDYILELESGDFDFHLQSSKPGFKLWMQKGSRVCPRHQVSRVEFEFKDVTVSELQRLIEDPTLRVQWDTNIKEYEIIDKDLDIDADVIYSSFKSPAPFKDCDFVDTRRRRLMSDGSLVSVSQVTLHNERPNRQSHLRCETLFSGTIIRPADHDGVVRCIIIGQVNPRRNVPTFLLHVQFPRVYYKWYRALKSSQHLLKG